jgi:hypothetical protein
MTDIDFDRCTKLSDNNFLVLASHFEERQQLMEKCEAYLDGITAGCISFTAERYGYFNDSWNKNSENKIKRKNEFEVSGESARSIYIFFNYYYIHKGKLYRWYGENEYHSILINMKYFKGDKYNNVTLECNDYEDCFSYPRDIHDWKRCFNLLKHFPNWNIKDMAVVNKQWKKIVDNWENIEKLSDSPNINEYFNP